MSDLKWDKAFANEQAGEDSELLAELLGLLCASSKSDLQKIRQALAAGEAEGVADAAHSIKGASASLGVEGLREVAHDIEKKGRAGQLDAIELGQIEELVGLLPTLTA